MREFAVCVIVGLCILLAFTGCGDGFDEVKVRAAIMKEMNTTDICVCPDYRWKFIVRDKEANIWIVDCRSSKAEITSKSVIFYGSNGVKPILEKDK